MSRQDQLRLLLNAQPVACYWSARLSDGDPDRAEALRKYFLALAETEIGLSREVRRGLIAGTEVLLLVDEYAEALHSVPRPRLPARLERTVRPQLSGAFARPAPNC